MRKWFYGMLLLVSVQCSSDRGAAPSPPAVADEVKNDSDYSGIVKDLTESKITSSLETFADEQQNTWKLQIFKANLAGPVLFLPHDDENTALQAAIRFIGEHGGKVLAIDCDEKRQCFGIDPNRYFNESTIFSERIFNHYLDQSLMISLHNNREGYGGGRGQITACQPNPWVSAVAFRYNGATEECDNLIVVNGRESSPSGALRDLQLYLQAAKVNLVYERYQAANDGSASHAATARNLFYVNVEAKDGELERQLAMLETFYKWYQSRQISSVKKATGVKKAKKPPTPKPETPVRHGQ